MGEARIVPGPVLTKDLRGQSKIEIRIGRVDLDRLRKLPVVLAARLKDRSGAGELGLDRGQTHGVRRQNEADFLAAGSVARAHDQGLGFRFGGQ